MDELAKIKAIKKNKQSRSYVTGLHSTPAGMEAAELLLKYSDKTNSPALFALIVFPDIDRLLSLGSFVALKDAWAVMARRMGLYMPSGSLCTQTQFGLLIQVWDKKAAQKLAREELGYLLKRFNRPFKLSTSSNISSFSLRSYAGYLLLPNENIAKGNAESLISKLAIAAHIANQSEEKLKQFSPALQKLLSRQEYIISHLPIAIQKEQFDLSFEPQFSSQTKLICGAQARLIWQNSSHGNIDRTELANAFSLTGTLPDAVKLGLRSSISFLKSLAAKRELTTDFKLSISIPFEALLYKDFDLTNELEKLLSNSKIDSRHLNIELEGNLEFSPTKYNDIASRLKRINALDIPIGLDPTTATNLNALTLLHTRVISFLKWNLAKPDSLKTGHSIELLGSAIAIARHHGIKVAVGGIELNEQLKRINLREIETLQGPLFSKPLSGPGFQSYLRYLIMAQKQKNLPLAGSSA